MRGYGYFSGNSLIRKESTSSLTHGILGVYGISYFHRSAHPEFGWRHYCICSFSIDLTCLSKRDFLSSDALMPQLVNVICFCGSWRAPKLLEICCMLIAMVYLHMHCGRNIFGIPTFCCCPVLDGVIQENLFTKGKTLTKWCSKKARSSRDFVSDPWNYSS